jgi:hypothetical protein
MYDVPLPQAKAPNATFSISANTRKYKSFSRLSISNGEKEGGGVAVEE